MRTSPDWNFLVREYLSGDSLAFDELYSTVYPRVLGFIESRFGLVHFAQDAAAETLIKVWKNIERFNQTRGDFLIWVFQIAYNTTLDFLRQRKRNTHLPLEVVLSLTTDDRSRTGLSEVDLNLIRKLLRRVPEKNRRVVIQRIYQDMTAEEISIAEGVKVGTVRSRYRLALELLRKQISGEREDWI